MLYKKAINNNTKGRKRYKQSAERKNKVPFVLSLGSCFGERLKSACLMCLNKSSFMREKRGKKATSFFLNFFSQLNFFSCLQKNVTFSTTRKKKLSRFERKTERDVAELKREIFSFLVETTRHTYKSRITSQQKIQTSWCIQ